MNRQGDLNGSALLARAREWASEDPDPATASELRDLVAAAESGDDAATAELEDRFSGTLEFGTAGLRGALGAGPNRMNRVVVLRAAAGLAAFLAKELGEDAGARSAGAAEAPAARVVIGYDARHRSRDFAIDTAAVMTAAGHEALLLPGALPTPVLAFAVKALDADAGVMVTASHNPPGDNGYKVYLGGRMVEASAQGAQIVPPYDARIAAHIAQAASVAAVARAAQGWRVLDDSLADDYVRAAVAVIGRKPATASARRDVRIVTTALHGVGAHTLERALRGAGFEDLHAVPEQDEPDPDFPTVHFPNPEEKGAMDLALALAQELDPDVVIANDPDADRCAMAVPIDGTWTMLHGDVVGSLLGERVASSRPAGAGGVIANSIVSSRQLAQIAAAHGLEHRSTLTGFKWIAREEGLVYGYEEALGYCVAPGMVADKDGITASLMIADMVADLKEQGRTVADAIDDLARSYGLYLTSQVSARFADTSRIDALMAHVLAEPPTHLGGAVVTSTDDMSAGIEGLPPTTGLRLLTSSGSRVIVRPSGTEPKIKAYLEVVQALEVVQTADKAGDLTPARTQAADAMAQLERDVRLVLGIG